MFLYAVPTQVLAGPTDTFAPVIEVGDVAARALFGDGAGQLVSSVIALALVSSVSAMIMAGPRVYAAMATDRALPQQLARHNKRGVPVVAVVTQGVLAQPVRAGRRSRLADPVRRVHARDLRGADGRRGVHPAPARAARGRTGRWGYPVTPIAFIALSAWIAYAQISSQPKESAIVGVVLVVGALLYLAMSRHKPPLADESLPELPEARIVPRDDDAR